MSRRAKFFLSAITASLLYLGSAATVMAIPSLSWTTSTLDSSNGQYQYSYAINNDLTGQAIDHFEIVYNQDIYSLLNLDSGLAGWTFALNDTFNGNGYQDGLLSATIASGTGLLPGESLNFAVSFFSDYSPIDSPDVLAPGDQAFTYTTVAVGSPEPVPEPGTIMLLGFGLAGFAGYRRFVRNRLGA